MSEELTFSIEKSTEINPEYSERLASIGDFLKKVMDQDENFIQYGPTYEVVTSSGQKLEVFTFHFDWTDKNGKSYRKMHLVALDDSGHIVGDRYTTLRFREWEGEKYAEGEGMIATGVRGKGLALPIERVHEDLLQREANRLNQRVRWHTSNANQERLNDEEDEYKRTNDPSLLPKIEAMRIEQQRWQSIYGENGKLGFGDNANKDFQPNGGDARIDEIESIAQSDLGAEIIEATQDVNQKRKTILKTLIAQMVAAQPVS